MNSRLAKSIVAVFAAPMIAGVVVGLIWIMTSDAHSEEQQRLVMKIALILASMFGIPGTLIIGLPIHALLLAQRWTNWWSYAIGGIACGFLYEGLALLLVYRLHPSKLPSNMVEYTNGTAIMVVAGTITAVCGWLIRRPDRD
jgi:hypothetical protein